MASARKKLINRRPDRPLRPAPESRTLYVAEGDSVKRYPYVMQLESGRPASEGGDRPARIQQWGIGPAVCFSTAKEPNCTFGTASAFNAGCGVKIRVAPQSIVTTRMDPATRSLVSGTPQPHRLQCRSRHRHAVGRGPGATWPGDPSRTLTHTKGRVHGGHSPIPKECVRG